MGKVMLNGREYISSTGLLPECYSTEERTIGTWVDGKPLYQKVISGNMPVTSDNTFTNAYIDIASLSVDFMFGPTILFFSSNNQYFVLPYITNSGYIAKVTLDKAWNRITLTTNGSAFSNQLCYTILYYTKTTDTPGSGTYTPNGTLSRHYSTTEHIIGTWTDGKPLYEKLIDEVIPDDKNMNQVASFSGITVRFIDNPMFVAPGGLGYMSYTWNNYTFTYAATDNGIWVQRLTNTGSPWNTGVKFRCAVQYTKTTD